MIMDTSLKNSNHLHQYKMYNETWSIDYYSHFGGVYWRYLLSHMTRLRHHITPSCPPTGNFGLHGRFQENVPIWGWAKLENKDFLLF